MTDHPSTSYAADKDTLLKRLRRMEGQVRGIQQMVEEDRYCVDIVTQLQAVQAAAREVSLIVLEDHLRGCVQHAIQGNQGEEAIEEMVTVLGKALRQ